VFSLRTADDFGIGEFRDLRPLVDWAAATGQCIIQLLPVNDTTRKGLWQDSYPYSPVSTFALHPLYMRLQEIGVPVDKAFLKEQAELNALPELDYPKVFKAKMKRIRKAFEDHGAKDLATAACKRFIKDNAAWLPEYAEFCARRDGLEPEYDVWMQYHLDRQFSEEVAYARSKDVHFKGDLPIGVSADSAEAYWHPELFNLDSSTGAPPDYFSTDGQNWGFPTYNWEEMAKDDYAWWKARLRKMSQYFDAFRIDHILGFFRIWEIPTEFKSGMMGHFNPALPYSLREIQDMGLPLDGLFHPDPRHPGMYQPLIAPASAGLPQWQQERFGALYNDFFYHRHDEFWRRNAEHKLPELLGATGMLACGEDLGMVPDCVPGVMDHWRILSLKMRGMEQEGPWKELSVCATSSHDMETLRMQCKQDPTVAECRDALLEFLNSPSMLAIFPLQDWLSIDLKLRRKDRDEERINQPADPHHHWRFRIHFDLRDLAQAEAFTYEVRDLVKASGR
jgi:4-alpha-glucanotransferase